MCLLVGCSIWKIHPITRNVECTHCLPMENQQSHTTLPPMNKRIMQTKSQALSMLPVFERWVAEGRASGGLPISSGAQPRAVPVDTTTISHVDGPLYVLVPHALLLPGRAVRTRALFACLSACSFCVVRPQATQILWHVTA
jgi:hypothetical protein